MAVRQTFAAQLVVRESSLAGRAAFA